MNISKNINYILIAVGAVVSLYAQNQENQNEALLIGGIVVLMIGIYKISRHIPNKKDVDDEFSNTKEP